MNFGIIISTVYKMKAIGDLNTAIISSRFIINLVFLGVMYLYNLTSIVTN